MEENKETIEIKDNEQSWDGKFTDEQQEKVNEIISNRLSKEKSKWEKEKETEKEEAARLAKLSAEEREREKFKKQQEEFDKQKSEFQKKELVAETKNELVNRKLPIEFAELLVGKDAETTLESVKQFEIKFNEAVANAVEGKFKENGRTPTIKTEERRIFTREQIKSMTPEEINANWSNIKNLL